jgi:hypothetical protein
MAVVEKRVSDLSGAMSDDMGRLTILSHPKFNGPIELDVLDDEVEKLDGLGDIVEVEVTTSAGRTRRLMIAAEDFDRLADNMDGILTEAVARSASHRTVTQAAARKRQPAKRKGGTGVEQYGFPRRGRASAEEAEYVRTNLDEVQERLTAAGVRLIDPSNPDHIKRYRLDEG